ncbi:MAG: ferredoxin, partial [Candidatus Latescibacterota bacterium]
IVAALTDEGDEGNRLKRRIYQLESKVKALADDNPGTRLSTLWKRGINEMLSGRSVGDDDAKALNIDMKAVGGALNVDGEVLTCNTRIASRLFESVIKHQWIERSADFTNELDSLIHDLDGVLAADFAQSPEGMSAEHLKAAAGSEKEDSVNYEAMSSILKQSDLVKQIPEARRKRLEETLAILRGVQPIFVGQATSDTSKTVSNLRIEVVENDCSAAVHRFADQMATLVDFFKAVRIAKLEIENKYHPPVHDPFFARFGVMHLTVDEFALCPPVLLTLTNEFFSGPDKGAVLDILGAGIPIKILMQLDDLFYNGDSANDLAVALSWPSRLANMAVSLNNVYVLQSPVSNPALLQRGFVDGFQYDGPALFSVYTGSRDNQPGLTMYHNAAAATESRIFPSLAYNPAGGDTLDDRADIMDNPQVERAWPSESFSYQNEVQDTFEIDLDFTPADFLACDVRLARHFWRVPASKWHADMVPLAEFLQLDEAAAETKVPYLTAVGIDNEIERVVMTRLILSVVRRCELSWRYIQELGGVDNSFASKALEQEKDRLIEEKDQQVSAVETQYQDELNRNLGDLTRELIQRMVEEVTSGGGIGAPEVAAPAGPAPPEAVPEAPETTEAPPAPEAVEEEEDEDEVSFDDPYIDTPLCTTCNECTNINSRMFAYNENKQATIKDATAGTYAELVQAAEKCPVHIIHPGKPKNPDEPGLDGLIERGAKFN